MVYHIEMYSLQTILLVIASNLNQIPKVVYQYNHNQRMELNMAMCIIIRCEYFGNIYYWKYVIRKDIQWLIYLYNAGLKLWHDGDKHHQLPAHRHIT